MRAKNKSLFVPVVLCVTLIVILFSCRMQVFAKQSSFTQGTDLSESSYRRALSEQLRSVGIKNAGINMTKLTEDGYHIKYKIDIYLPSYIDLSNSEKAQLIAFLSEIEFEVENATVSFNFFRERG